jgi:hypothetical protein
VNCGNRLHWFTKKDYFSVTSTEVGELNSFFFFVTFMNACHVMKTFLGNHKAENYHEIVSDLLTG